MGLEVVAYESFTGDSATDSLPEYLRYDQEWGAFMGAWKKFKGLRINDVYAQYDLDGWYAKIGAAIPIGDNPPAGLLAEAVEWFTGVMGPSGSVDEAEYEEKLLEIAFYSSNYPEFMRALRKRYELVRKTEKLSGDSLPKVDDLTGLMIPPPQRRMTSPFNRGGYCKDCRPGLVGRLPDDPDRGGIKPDESDPYRD